MVIEKISIHDLISDMNGQLSTESSHISTDFKNNIEKSLHLLKIMSDRLSTNSDNSNKPPSQDKNRDKKQEKEKRKSKGEKRKPGGQPGHEGKTLEKIDNPDKIVEMEVDRSTLPDGDYEKAGYETRQVHDVEISVVVTEYRAEILKDKHGNQYVAQFPKGVDKAAQYGNTVKSLSVYLSVFQLIPLDRIRDFFNDQLGLPISKGSISNFNKVASENLKELGFTDWVKKQLLHPDGVVNADETGINVDGGGYWLHSLSNEKVTLYHADKKRGTEAMDRMGVLPHFEGILCHDHWKPYYTYDCIHALCNAHHQRELEFAFKQDGQKWAKKIKELLEKIRKKVEASTKGCLETEEGDKFSNKYRSILAQGKKECPAPPPKPKGKKGPQKKSKSRNLLERLVDYEDDTLRFMKNPKVPYTNNLGEGDIRMAKIQQNVSKCFRSLEGAKRFCDNRGYITTSRKNGVSATKALILLFRKEKPFFMRE